MSTFVKCYSYRQAVGTKWYIQTQVTTTLYGQTDVQKNPNTVDHILKLDSNQARNIKLEDTIREG
jgi:hypothetical protein